MGNLGKSGSIHTCTCIFTFFKSRCTCTLNKIKTCESFSYHLNFWTVFNPNTLLMVSKNMRNEIFLIFHLFILKTQRN